MAHSTSHAGSFLLSIYDLFAKFNKFHVVQCVHGNEVCLVVSHRQLYDHPPLGIISRCMITIKNQEYIVQIVTREVERGVINTVNASDVVKTLQQVWSVFSRV